MIIGISGTKLTEKKQLLAIHGAVGVMTFSRNIENTSKGKLKLQKLVWELKSILGPHAIISIDQEGGRVQRIKPPIAQKLYPPQGYFGLQYNDPNIGKEQAMINFYENMKELGNELRGFGFNMDASPVVRYVT